jgi:hypothetical protein
MSPLRAEWASGGRGGGGGGASAPASDEVRKLQSGLGRGVGGW